jgi:hypothetical protein
MNLAEERKNLKVYRKRIQKLEFEYRCLENLLYMDKPYVNPRIETRFIQRKELLSNYRLLVQYTKNELQRLSYS